MKWLCFTLFSSAVLAQDITFTNRVVTFTNLQGTVYKGVTLTKTTPDGIIWRDGAAGGHVSDTNLSPVLLESWGIPTNHIEGAKKRAERKAAADARYRAAQQAQASAQASSQANRLAAEKLRGLREFDLEEMANFPRKIKWAERGWMDVVFEKNDASASDYPELVLAFTVRDKEDRPFRRVPC